MNGCCKHEVYLQSLQAAAAAADVVPSPDNGRSAAAMPGAYLGNKEPTIWKRPTILTIGDSITEGGLDAAGGWTAKLANAYARKVGCFWQEAGVQRIHLLMNADCHVVPTSQRPGSAT
jgi:hypothetical protein